MNEESGRRVISLTEYVSQMFPSNALSPEEGELIWKKYKDKVSVDFPSPKTENQWLLSSQGWVGYLPCTPDLGISLKPKVELSNIFRMLEYAYQLNSFQILEGLTGCSSIQEFYERLANILAQRILDRSRKGLYRTYLNENDQLPFIRGRVDVPQCIKSPWDVKVHCHYQEHTADIEENQILCWTMALIARSGICTERVLPTVRRAFHALRGFASLNAVSPRNCIKRLYNRLNEDYRPLHALCRFFLEHSGPTHHSGDKTMLPFVVDMARLYELFVAEWLRTHLPASIRLGKQETVTVGENNDLSFQIDLVLYDAHTDKALCVLDTKYKAKHKPEAHDVTQVVTYAEMKNCEEAILIYPVPLDASMNEKVGEKIRVRTMAFALSGDLEAAGQMFMGNLLQTLGVSHLQQ
ncbi:MAG TPA: restriction endonuclease [Thermodesulfobacteriota bacterium]|nr:restriction endonuclease [Thermodesulfobacteriota bacterium]